jgi:hypothetical protein
MHFREGRKYESEQRDGLKKLFLRKVLAESLCVVQGAHENFRLFLSRAWRRA